MYIILQHCKVSGYNYFFLQCNAIRSEQFKNIFEFLSYLWKRVHPTRWKIKKSWNNAVFCYHERNPKITYTHIYLTFSWCIRLDGNIILINNYQFNQRPLFADDILIFLGNEFELRTRRDQLYTVWCNQMGIVFEMSSWTALTWYIVTAFKTKHMKRESFGIFTMKT